MANQDNRREFRHVLGATKTAKLAPVMATAVLGGEAGMLAQRVNLKLAPMGGELRSAVNARFVSVFCPLQSLVRLGAAASSNDYVTEVLRKKLMDGTDVLGFVAENNVTKRLNVHPMQVGGVKRVNAGVHRAHAVAVNHLRKKRYIYADLLPTLSSATDSTPAIVNATVLDRFNGALDPDDHINGNVEFDFNATRAPVKGITQNGNGNQTVVTSLSFKALSTAFEMGQPAAGEQPTTFQGPTVKFARKSGAGAGDLDIYADLSAIEAGGFSLTDLYQAQKADSLVRQMRSIADANPNDGEDAVLRWAFGLRAESAAHPFVIYDTVQPVQASLRRAMDGAGMETETVVSELQTSLAFEVPVPATELGGFVITFLQVTPDETIADQPHPIMADTWKIPNQAADQLKVDPVAVQLRQLRPDPATADEANTMFYVGHNEMKRNYISLGLSRALDPNTVQNKTVWWQYAIPAGVSPSNILYPADFPQYPFLDQAAEVVTYDIQSELIVRTPLVFGPSPVEKVAIVDAKEILG